ncbi:MAG: hypothetical protein HY053_07430 [Proteobacteria bacterium]|nr:hypothetical protein [Pseudomonadota bacterium]
MRRGWLFLQSVLAALLLAGAPLHAFAQEAEKTEPGLPQLDPTHFPGQAFWLIIAFSLTYLLMRYVALPRVQSTLEAREARMVEDLDHARLLNERAKLLSTELELRMADARTRAQDDMREAAQKNMAKLTTAFAEQQKVLDQKLQEAQTRLAGQKKQTLAALDEEAAGMVEAILKRLTGTAVPPDQARTAWQKAKEA